MVSQSQDDHLVSPGEPGAVVIREYAQQVFQRDIEIHRSENYRDVVREVPGLDDDQNLRLICLAQANNVYKLAVGDEAVSVITIADKFFNYVKNATIPEKEE